MEEGSQSVSGPARLRAGKWVWCVCCGWQLSSRSRVCSGSSAPPACPLGCPGRAQLGHGARATATSSHAAPGAACHRGVVSPAPGANRCHSIVSPAPGADRCHGAVSQPLALESWLPPWRSTDGPREGCAAVCARPRHPQVPCDLALVPPGDAVRHPPQLGAGLGCRHRAGYWYGHRHGLWVQAWDGFSTQTPLFSEPKQVPEGGHHRLPLAAARETSPTEASLQFSLTRLPAPTQVPCSLPTSPRATPRGLQGQSCRQEPHTRSASNLGGVTCPCPAYPGPGTTARPSPTTTSPAPRGASTALCQQSPASEAPARPFPKRPGFPPEHRAAVSLDSKVEVLL